MLRPLRRYESIPLSPLISEREVAKKMVQVHAYRQYLADSEVICYGTLCLILSLGQLPLPGSARVVSPLDVTPEGHYQPSTDEPERKSSPSI